MLGASSSAMPAWRSLWTCQVDEGAHVICAWRILCLLHSLSLVETASAAAMLANVNAQCSILRPEVMKQSDRLVRAGVGHCGMDEAPELVNPLILKFVRRHS